MTIGIGLPELSTRSIDEYNDITERGKDDGRHRAARHRGGALPPGFPPVEIDGEWYWDGGIASNSPLWYVFDESPRTSALILQVDLFDAAGEKPHNLEQAQERVKDIQYASKQRMNIQRIQELEETRAALARVLESGNVGKIPSWRGFARVFPVRTPAGKAFGPGWIQWRGMNRRGLQERQQGHLRVYSTYPSTGVLPCLTTYQF